MSRPVGERQARVVVLTILGLVVLIELVIAAAQLLKASYDQPTLDRSLRKC
jgi:hypothetical protein